MGCSNFFLFLGAVVKFRGFIPLPFQKREVAAKTISGSFLKAFEAYCKAKPFFWIAAKTISGESIINATACYFGIYTEDILGKSHAQEFVLARQIAMQLCRSQLHLPFMKIGSIFSRDHSTVMTSVKQIQQRLEEFDQEVSLAIAEIQRKLV